MEAEESILDEAVIGQLVELAAGKLDFAERVITLFIEQGDELHEALREASAQGDAEAIYQAAHKLGGSAANVGGVQLRARCIELERSARAGSFGPFQVDEVLASYEATCDALRARWP